MSPWPISEGLCTLEMHRDLPIDVQARHMKMLGMVDDWFIGNAYASDEELKAISEIYQSQIDILHIKCESREQDNDNLKIESVIISKIYLLMEKAIFIVEIS